MQWFNEMFAKFDLHVEVSSAITARMSGPGIETTTIYFSNQEGPHYYCSFPARIYFTDLSHNFSVEEVVFLLRQHSALATKIHVLIYPHEK